MSIIKSKKMQIMYIKKVLLLSGMGISVKNRSETENSVQEFQVRTDLAVELNEGIRAKKSQAKGIDVKEDFDDKSGLKITSIHVLDADGERMLKKPRGHYITTESVYLTVADEVMEDAISEKICEIIKELIEPYVKGKNSTILIVGLGNKEVTCDCLGPLVTEYISVLNHNVDEKCESITVTALAPGVKAQTGMETANIVSGVVKETKPDIIIAVDALAARNSARLNNTIQLSDQGIHPGSGVGNHRTGLNMSTVGIPVIAIGVPTVIEASTIVQDALENFTNALEQSENFVHICHMLKQLTPNEKRLLINEVIDPSMSEMYVTPRDVDASVRKVAYIIAQSINKLTKE